MNSDVVFQRLSELSRRELLSRGLSVAGWGAFAAVLGAGTIETVRFFFPRVIFRPPSTFRIGTPEEFLRRGGDADTYGIVFVDERWKSEQRFFIVRERGHVYAFSARCVHLGCTVNWFDDQRIFRCPCHGSEFRSSGVQFAGPASRPLDRFRIVLNAAGELVVDTSIVYVSDRFDVDGASVQI